MFSSIKYIGRLNNICCNTRRINKVLNYRVDKCFYKTSAVNQKDDKKENDLSRSATTKYDIFVDEESPIIFDIEQEREKYYEINDDVGRAEKKRKEFDDISPERGITGVIEIDELTNILRKENALDMIVIKVPDEYHYVDYMVIVSGKSYRHMKAMAEFIRRVYKYKTKSLGNIPNLEGSKSHDWLALDLGNIALHIMSKSTREIYNLESLWSLDREFDTQSRQKQVEETQYEDILKYLASSTNN